MHYLHSLVLGGKDFHPSCFEHYHLGIRGAQDFTFNRAAWFSPGPPAYALFPLHYAITLRWWG